MSQEEPKPFPWETPGPQGPFWSALDDNHGHIGRSYLSVFGASTIAQMPLDPSLPQKAKLAQLLSEAKSHLSDNPLVNHPNPESLSKEDWKSWRDILLLLANLELETGHTTEPEARYKQHIAAWQARFDAGIDPDIKMRDDISGLNALAYLYTKSGRYAEAEELALQLPSLMRKSPVLGPGPSPQEMGVVRMLIELCARQGKMDEVLWHCEMGYFAVEEMKGGKFDKYVDEEIEALGQVERKVKKWSKKAETG